MMNGGQNVRPRWQQSLSQEALWAIDMASGGHDIYGRRLSPEQAEAFIESHRAYSEDPHNNNRTIRPQPDRVVTR